MKRCFLLSIFIIIFALTASVSEAENSIHDKKRNNQPQRVVDNIIDYQRNTTSNIQFITNNIGNWSAENNSRGSLFWPRATSNQYIFNSGLWFGCQLNKDGKLESHVVSSIDPIYNKPMMAPGRIEDGYKVDSNNIKIYRVYFSTDMDENGAPYYMEDGPNWPVWKYYPASQDFSGSYVYDVENRRKDILPEGPVYLSEEDIFSTYKDTDTSFTNDSVQTRSPIGIQVEQMIYSWGFGFKKDNLIISYKLINMSNDTLFNCSIGEVIDFDIAMKINSQAGARNDRTDFYVNDPSMNTAYCWTDATMGEGGKGFGYLGLSLLSTPAVNDDGFLRKDKLFYNPYEQVGLHTFQSWTIKEDPKTENERYNFLSSNVIDRDNGPGDKRVYLGSGAFNMLPGDTVRMSFLVSLAMPAINENPDGSQGDIVNVISSVKKMRDFYYNEMIYMEAESEARQNPVGKGLTFQPNPASGTVKVSFNTAVPGKYKTDIYDVYGRKVDELSAQFFEAGKNYLNINTGSLLSGHYMVYIAGAGGVYSGNLVVSR